MKRQINKLPKSFKPLLWSYDFDNLDLKKDKKTIIVNTINYGDLKQWKWIKEFYGLAALKKTLMTVSATELRSRVKPLAQLIFSIPSYNDAPRSTH